MPNGAGMAIRSRASQVRGPHVRRRTGSLEAHYARLSARVSLLAYLWTMYVQLGGAGCAPLYCGRAFAAYDVLYSIVSPPY
jgi:hypothetical protein